MELDKSLRNALLRRATGYEVEERESIIENGKIKQIKVKKRHVPPDIEAIKIIRRLQDNGRW